MPSTRLTVGLLSLLELSSAYVQLDFDKRRVPLSQLHPAARQRYLKRAGTVSATLQNAQNNILYLVNVTVGSDKQLLGLQLDTGSSDIWLPYAGSSICESPDNVCINGAFNYKTSSTFNMIGNSGDFQISYVDGTQISGDYFEDTFGIGGATINNQIMALATDAEVNSESAPFQGIIGVGYPSGESSAADGQTYPNIINNLKSQGHTSTLAYSLWLNDLDASTGSILFGGVDTSRYTGDLTVLPIQPDSESDSLTSFTVVLDSFSVVAGNGKVQYSQSSLAMPVILDSGTSLTYIPDDMANAIASGVGAGSDGSGGFYVPCDLMNSPLTFDFVFGNSGGPKIQVATSEFVIPYPEQDGQQPTLEDGTVVCQWGLLGAGDSPNLFGDTFLRSAYVVYDISNNNIGIAQTKFNVSSSDSDIQEIKGSQIPGASSTASGAEVTQTATVSPTEPAGGSAQSTGNIGQESSATFDLGGSSTGGSSSSGGSASGSHSAGAAAGLPIPAQSTFVGFMTFAIVAISGLSGAMMVWL